MCIFSQLIWCRNHQFRPWTNRLLNSSLNLLDDSPQPQSSSSNAQIQCGQTTPQGSAHASNGHVPPMPYVNQTAVNQHMGTQPTQIPPRMSTGPTNLQPPIKTPPSQIPSDISCNDCPLLMHCRHPLKTILLTIQIRHLCVTSGLKVQTGKALSRLHQHHLPPLCQWESQDLFVGTVDKQDTLKRNCPNPPYCSKCKQKGHLPMKCPLKGKTKETPQMPQKDTTDVSGPEAFQYQEQMHPLWR